MDASGVAAKVKRTARRRLDAWRGSRSTVWQDARSFGAKPSATRPSAAKTGPKAGGRKQAAPRSPQDTEFKNLPSDFDDELKETLQLARPYTMTSQYKLEALVSAVRYLERGKVAGAFVECGVWRGGSMHAVARTLDHLGTHDRELYLFDTFTGMTEPTERDVSIGRSKTAAELLAANEQTANVWAVASLEDVRAGLETLPYPIERFHLVPGPVEETIPGDAPEQIALLRLDTDWYESTKHELEHLYERLVPGGVLIIDDYGSWQGARDATDEFMAKLDWPPLMLRAGRGRVGMKPVR